MRRFIMNLFWKTNFIPEKLKEKVYYLIRRIVKKETHKNNVNDTILQKYKKEILSISQMKEQGYYVPIINKKMEKNYSDPKLIAYYLPQFYPFKENDEWWGKGTTEWNNVNRAVPQFLGHYQPRLPGELGYYDLRLKENIQRQVELAKLYGIYSFCYYYYYFDGKRLLDIPLDLFLKSREIDFKFCLCWANEDWTKRFDGTSGEVIMKQSKNQDSYESFIESLDKYLKDDRYLQINRKKILVIYRPSSIPNCREVLKYWRNYCLTKKLGELYIIAVKELNVHIDWLIDGFDAISEFNPNTVCNEFEKITSDVDYIADEFYGHIFDYKEFVTNKKYKISQGEKLYKSVVPMWDNTARRNNKGHIYHGSTPELYEEWLTNIIRETRSRSDLDDNIVFINAWNEWGEGAYLEPDQKFGYAYLQATRNAIEKSRVDE